MSTKTASILASGVTALLLLVVMIFFGFGGLVLLNGFMDASAAVYTGFTCLGITLILCPILAGMLTKTLIFKFNWNTFWAGGISALVATLLGGGLGLAAMFVMVIVAEITRGA